MKIPCRGYRFRSCTESGFFFFNDTATTEIYTLSLHDALPIHAGPIVGRAGVGPRVLWPGFVTVLARPRNGVELPAQLPGSRVIGAYVAIGSRKALGLAASDNQQILVNHSRSGQGHRLLFRRTVQVLVQVDASAAAEAGNHLPGLRVERINIAAEPSEEPPVRANGPVGETAGALTTGFGIPGPDQPSGSPVEREELASRRVAVDQAIHKQGVGFEAPAPVGTIVGPGNL